MCCRLKRKDLATKGATKREKLPQKIEVTAQYNKYALCLTSQTVICGMHVKLFLEY